jgi:hypothetical protein
MKFNVSSTIQITLATVGSLICTSLATAAAPVINHPYTLSVFAKSGTGYSQPDSIVQWNNSIIIGFQNHVAKDGTDGKSSAIVQYSLKGAVQRTFSVPGHNDGLRVVGEKDLWCLQNEDANPNLVVIDLESGHQTLYKFAPTVHQGGFDDMVVVGGDVYMTASNPTLVGPQQINPFPALVRATLSGGMVAVTPVVYGNAKATDIATGASVTMNLTDPDSMSVDPRGNIVMDSQADGVLIFIKNVESTQRIVGQLTLAPAGVTVDDTAFAPGPQTFLLVTDVAGDTVYRIDNTLFGFEPGAAYSASDTQGFVATLNLDTGLLTPIATGFGSARGLLFVKTGEDSGDGGN